MTVLEIINKVMRRLREPQITTISDSEYSLLIADFVVDIHKELLDYDWSSMEHTITVPVDANQRILDLSRLEADGGDILAGGRLPTIDSVPLWAMSFEGSGDTQGMPLFVELPRSSEAGYYSDTAQRVNTLGSISFQANPDRDGLQAILNPIPSVTQYVRVRLWTPELEIVPVTDTARTPLVPWKPIYLGALWLALNERGEEMGEPGGAAESRYHTAVAQAKEADQLRKNDADQYVAERV